MLSESQCLPQVIRIGKDQIATRRETRHFQTIKKLRTGTLSQSKKIKVSESIKLRD